MIKLGARVLFVEIFPVIMPRDWRPTKRAHIKHVLLRFAYFCWCLRKQHAHT